MNAAPKKLSFPNSKTYVCPVSTSVPADISSPQEWVYCPMVEQPICWGACLDLQAVATTRKFEEHPDVDDFYKLSAQTKRDVSELRKICVDHQEEVLNEMLTNPHEDHDAIRALLTQIKKVQAYLSTI